jgi:transposase InsO family protein
MELELNVNQKLVARIMRDLNIHGLPQRKRVTRNLANVATHDDLANRNFVANRPNALWLTDITEHPTREGTVYCCCVLDLYSRKVVGWAIDRRCESIPVNDALSMAARTRITSPSTVIHSDQFTSWAFSQNVRRCGLLGSMGTVGDCYDCEHNRGVILGLNAKSNCSIDSAGRPLSNCPWRGPITSKTSTTRDAATVRSAISHPKNSRIYN